MIEHKEYECEYCGKEFEHDEYEVGIGHEAECDCNPALKRCGGCSYGEKVIHYECEYIQCIRLRSMDGNCNCWTRR